MRRRYRRCRHHPSPTTGDPPTPSGPAGSPSRKTRSGPYGPAVLSVRVTADEQAQQRCGPNPAPGFVSCRASRLVCQITRSARKTHRLWPSRSRSRLCVGSSQTLTLPPRDTGKTRIDACAGVATQLDGVRGSALLDRKALRELIVRFALLLQETPGIVEADLNPVRCTTHGCIVLDTRLRIEPRHPAERAKTW